MVAVFRSSLVISSEFIRNAHKSCALASIEWMSAHFNFVKSRGEYKNVSPQPRCAGTPNEIGPKAVDSGPLNRAGPQEE